MAKKNETKPTLKQRWDAFRNPVEKRVVEYVSTDNDDPADATTGIAAGGFGYRRMTAGKRESGIPFSENLQTVWSLYQSNPIGFRSTELKRDYITGSVHEITFKANDDDLQEILTAFWENNSLDERIGEFAMQLFLFGGQCYPAFVKRSDGAVKLSYIDPAEIEDVIPHPENSLEMWAVVVKPSFSAREWEQNLPYRVYRIIRKDDDAVIELVVNAQRVGEALKCNVCGGISHGDAQYCEHCNTPMTDRETEAIVKHSAHKGLYVTAEQATLEPWEARMLQAYGLQEYSGSCFYYRANAVSNQVTGFGDLLPVGDFLDQWDGTIFALGERELFRDFFSFDVTMTDADEAQVRERAQSIRRNPPARGAANVHNEKEVWDIFAPDLGQAGSVATSQEQKNNILAGLGYPQAWFGSPSGAHLATLQAQGDPTWRSLKHDQGKIQVMIETFLEFARDQAIIAGAWNTESLDGQLKDKTIVVTMPEMTARDVTQIGAVISTVTAALTIGTQEGWITDEQAQAVYVKVLSELGADIQEVEEEGAEDNVETNDDATENDRLWRDSYFSRQAPVSEVEQ